MEIAGQGRVTRTTVFVAVFTVAIMLVPGLLLGNQDHSATFNASAVDPSRVLRIGWPGFYSNVGTLNPHTMTMGQEFMLILACYSYLLTYDVNNQVINDLATKYEVSADGKDWHFWIVHTASFYNKNTPTVQVPLTVDDVMFSFWLAQNNSVSIMNYYFPDDPDTGVPLMTGMTRVNDFEMIFHLRESFSPFQSALVGVPILPKYIWQGKPVGWANYDHATPPCVGSGPYYYGLNNIAEIQDYGSSNIMNPTWFGITERGWQPKVYEFKVKSETDASGIQNFKDGNLDILISPTPAQYAGINPSDYPGRDIKKFTSSQGFVLDLCINQLTPFTQAKYGMSGIGNQLLLDPTVKYALKACVDKTTIVNAALLGGGSPADSLMPSSSVWYYNYGSNTLRDTNNGRGVIPDAGDIPGARAALMAAGWKYRSVSPYLELLPTDSDYNTYNPLAKVGGTQVLSFRYLYCDWYDFIMAEGPYIKTWAGQAGIQLVGGPATSAAMNSAWSSGDFDVYLWDWWFSPNSEPSLDVMELYSSSSIANNTDVNDYSPDVYDPMYYESLTTSDFATRKALLDEMQRWAYENSGYWPVAYRDNLYLAQIVAPNYWTNYGDWNAHYGLCPDSNLFWLYVSMNPRDQPAPTVSMTVYDTTTTDPVTYTVDANDDYGLEYKWIWGDGTSTVWSTSYAQSKIYATDGVYEVRLLVKESVGPDWYISYAKQQVTVVDMTNALPVVLAWTPSPSAPTVGEVVYFNGSATDADIVDRPNLAYSWNFGDGTTVDGQNVIHRFTAVGTPSVTLSVTDGRIGADARPATKTQSIQVFLNLAPSITVGDYMNVDKNQLYTFSVTATDPNTRDPLLYTWEWGDGKVSVTTTKSTRHTYKFTGSYTLTVWVDDQTGITSPSHNVSDTGAILVVPPSTNHAPVMTTSGFTVSTATPWVGQTVIFYAVATDADGDILDVTFDFGDGTTYTQTQSDPNASVAVAHIYSTVNDFFPSVTYTDGMAAAVTKYSTDMSPMWWVTTQYFELTLVAGWNFVTVPLVGHGYTANSLGLLFGDIVAGYNPETEDYDQIFIIGLYPTELDFAISENTGYWISASAAETLLLDGSFPTTTQSRVIAVPDGGGWAIVGFNTFKTTMYASDIPGMFTGGTIDVVAAYDAATGEYTRMYITIFGFDDFVLVPGEAYWCACSASGTLTYVP
ncbi:MAG: PKD domain-containing protein [Thermoplasmata archaeon]|nr:PKD domain-containing protein [Thermoplasmata archaeon]